MSKLTIFHAQGSGWIGGNIVYADEGGGYGGGNANGFGEAFGGNTMWEDSITSYDGGGSCGSYLIDNYGGGIGDGRGNPNGGG